VLVAFGDTRVLCTASVEDGRARLPARQGPGLAHRRVRHAAALDHTRTDREAAKGKQSGRTLEIQRLIGRSLRAVVDLEALGERTVQIDCDVLQADGGTRTASITGACVAVHDASEAGRRGRGIAAPAAARFRRRRLGGRLRRHAGARSRLSEDSACDTDMNVVMTASGGMIEVQGTAEGAPFSRAETGRPAGLAERGIAQLVAAQKKALGL
jgi:ribonuclease PH